MFTQLNRLIAVLALCSLLVQPAQAEQGEFASYEGG